jgi:hypothetical protein
MVIMIMILVSVIFISMIFSSMIFISMDPREIKCYDDTIATLFPTTFTISYTRATAIFK